jgi:tripartite-type tricarboxylate transporter receptor subunit TctC
MYAHREAWRALALSAVLLAMAPAAARAANDYPAAPIRLIIPTSPGGNVDMTGRAIGSALGRLLHTTIVIENMPGAANAIGAAYVARARPDGYTLLCNTSYSLETTFDLDPSAGVKLENYAPVGMITVTPAVLEVKAGNGKGIRSFADFLAYAKAHPGELSLGNSGSGSINHLTELMIERTFDIKLNLIPFKGAAPGIPAVLGDQIDGLVDQVSSSGAMLRAGKLLPLAITSPARSSDYPDVPTLAELSQSKLSIEVYTVLAAPKGTPPAILRVLNDALNHALAEPDVQRTFRQAGATPYPTSIDGASKTMAADKATLDPYIRSGLFASH